jgi:hypothetical protein
LTDKALSAVLVISVITEYIEQQDNVNARLAPNVAQALSRRRSH